MRAYLEEAAEIAASSQFRIDLSVQTRGVLVRGRTNNGGVIQQLVLWPQIEQAIINPVAITIQLIEQEIDQVHLFQEQIGEAFQ